MDPLHLKLLDTVSRGLANIHPSYSKRFDDKFRDYAFSEHLSFISVLSSGLNLRDLDNCIRSALTELSSELLAEHKETHAASVWNPLIAQLVAAQLGTSVGRSTTHLSPNNSRGCKPKPPAKTAPESPAPQQCSKSIPATPQQIDKPPTEPQPPKLSVWSECRPEEDDFSSATTPMDAAEPSNSSVTSGETTINYNTTAPPPDVLKSLEDWISSPARTTTLYGNCRFARVGKHACLARTCSFCSAFYKSVTVTRCGSEDFMDCTAESPCHETNWYPHVGYTVWKRMFRLHRLGTAFVARRTFPHSIDHPERVLNVELDKLSLKDQRVSTTPKAKPKTRITRGRNPPRASKSALKPPATPRKRKAITTIHDSNGRVSLVTETMAKQIRAAIGIDSLPGSRE